jgi:hypothetical protein
MKREELKAHIMPIGWPYSLKPRLMSLWKWEVMEMRASSSRENCLSMSSRSELILCECALNIAEVMGMMDVNRSRELAGVVLIRPRRRQRQWLSMASSS